MENTSCKKTSTFRKVGNDRYESFDDSVNSIEQVGNKRFPNNIVELNEIVDEASIKVFF